MSWPPPNAHARPGIIYAVRALALSPPHSDLSGFKREDGSICAWLRRKHQKNVLSHVQGAGKILAGAWRFVPLCADTAGGWDDAAIETLTKCASHVDLSRRGHVVGLWWQLLSVAFQKERERILCHKAISSLQGEGGDLVDALDADLLLFVPCLTV